MGLTPMMRQYMEIKNRYEAYILFFRLGDFYEMFFDDALKASKALEITLTGKDCGLEERAPMCGVPYHSAETYIRKLIDKGFKVAICEQTGDPRTSKGLVDREVVRIVTPGTITNPDMLEPGRNNYILALSESRHGMGLAYVDITTGELRITSFKGIDRYRNAKDELLKIDPQEILTDFDSLSIEMNEFTVKNLPGTLLTQACPAFEQSRAERIIRKQFRVVSVDSLGISKQPEMILALGGLIEYILETQKVSLPHISEIQHYNPTDHMIVDHFTARNLELSKTIMGGQKKGSLLWVLDKTMTSMGSRLLGKWLHEPLLDPEAVNERLEGVEWLFNRLQEREEIREILSGVYDLERLTSKVVYGNLNGRDLRALKSSLEQLPLLRTLLASTSGKTVLSALAEALDPLEDIHALIERAIVENPPAAVTEGELIKSDFHPELKTLREVLTNGKAWIRDIETRERERTGIKSLKIKFNKVFGYYIEVTKSNLDLVPEDYVRKQTLVNAERYITTELKTLEERIVNAEADKNRLEYDLFQSVRDTILEEVARLLSTAGAIARLDVLSAFAHVAYHNGYAKPLVSDSPVIRIQGGRHPVVEKFAEIDHFIPNDTELDNGRSRFHIITGPNMAGKSTYLRQVALLVLMAQIGSYVPAENAEIGIVDRIFTRVGASDDLFHGQSTFMVEMSELSNILTHATDRSLVILDEIGRGTSTYDGLSIAWSVVEYVNNPEHIGAKTLFATHYHELTELEGNLDGVQNHYISVREIGDDIIFLRKISRGGAGHSYGVQVAKLAGLPYKVIERATEILSELEAHDINRSRQERKPTGGVSEKALQLDFFEGERQAFIEEIRAIEINRLSPLEALNLLHELVGKASTL